MRNSSTLGQIKKRSLINMKKETAFCRRHPTSYIGKDHFGNWYEKCWTGHKFNEACEIVIEGGRSRGKNI